jgi:hypothetical protein
MSDATNPVAELLERAYRDMDPSTGMFPADWTCRVCGKRLNADGHHPAELYAGTFTGLCYGCERGAAYVVPDSELPDGARRVSHPPSCPSWRRDRTEHWAYPDCEECGGMGARMRYGRNGQYTEYCRPCLTRVSVPRRTNEVALLRTIAGALTMVPLRDVEPDAELTPAQASAVELVGRVTKMAERMFSREPAVWRPSSPALLRAAEGRLKPAQRNVKRADTLRRHLVAALLAEADAREVTT